MPIQSRKLDESELEQCQKELLVYGYCVVQNFLEPDSIDQLRQGVDKVWRAGVEYSGLSARDLQDKVVYNLQNKDTRFIELISLPELHRILMPKLNDPYYRFLPQDVPNYYLHYYNARSSGQKLDLHIDSHVPFPGKRAIVMQSAFLLNDQTEENGCTIVVPGSHVSGEFTDRDLKNVKPVIAKAGDAVFWDSRLWHGTLENRTGADRWSLIATWGMWWIKPAMDITRGLPQEVYAQLDDRQKSLLGFCSIPPIDESERINTKTGYESLLPDVSDYYSK